MYYFRVLALIIVVITLTFFLIWGGVCGNCQSENDLYDEEDEEKMRLDISSSSIVSLGPATSV